MANFEITDPIYLVNKASSVDSLYGTYPSLAAATTALANLALPGRQFAVQEPGQPVKLYIWQGVGVDPTPAGRTDFIPLVGNTSSTAVTGNIFFESYSSGTIGRKGIKFKNPDNADAGLLNDEGDQWISLMYDYRGSTPSEDVYTDIAAGKGFAEMVVREGEDGFSNNASVHIEELAVRITSLGKNTAEFTIDQDGITHVGEFKSPTTWTNSSLRMTAMADKSNDLSYAYVLAINSQGYIGKRMLSLPIERVFNNTVPTIADMNVFNIGDVIILMVDNVETQRTKYLGRTALRWTGTYAEYMALTVDQRKAFEIYDIY